MAIYISGLNKEKEAGDLRRGETFLYQEEYFLVTEGGPFSLTTGFEFTYDLSVKVEVVHLNLSRVVYHAS